MNLIHLMRRASAALAMLLAICAVCTTVAAGDPSPTIADNPLQLLPDHATASVADMDKEVAWYERVLGFHEVGRNGTADFQVSHLLLGDYRIDLAWQKGSSRAPLDGYQRQGWMHVVFRSPKIEAVYQQLSSAGTDVRKDSNDKGEIRRIIVHDAEGNELEVVSSDFAATKTTGSTNRERVFETALSIF